MSDKKTAVAVNPLEGKDKEALLTMLLAQEITRDEYSLALAALEEGALRVLSVVANPEKGTMSVVGLNKQFPVTLYPAQWARLFDEAQPMVKKFASDYAKYLPQAKGVAPKEKVPAELIGKGKPFRVPTGKPAADAAE